MKRATTYLIITAASLLAALAWAGSRARESNGTPPADGAACDGSFGVSLIETESCRLSVRSADGGAINADTIVSYYCDAASNGWHRSPSSLDCTIERNATADGGTPTAFTCADTEVLSRFGRQGAALAVSDGGTATGVVRVECFGRELP